VKWYQATCRNSAGGRRAGQPARKSDEEGQGPGRLAETAGRKPKVAVENLSFKTANGESRFSLSMDFAAPTSFDLPPDQLASR
jgi:hypothetical protein